MSDAPEVDASSAAKLIDEGGWLLDVREDDEWAAGHAVMATQIRMENIPEQLDEIPTDRTVVTICRSGARSARVADYLRRQGVDAVNVVDGMRGWAAAGLAVVTDSGDSGTVI